ncbi:MAG: ATP-dependent Clp protease proteolytic subunit [Elusimicrobia bacterium CG1_02_63_36]|nr:MAG: ATP-dependent Clp protease proteolytic subunit [Elusimicrobia bacterium CG1_02_63_36]PIP81755.1 MAG: ATP-dependent Clp protease proteolytic subunit [Elusimicrobia bacterium CG22_combo_CG10-13_8_21_14_all_63_91]PJA18038.1 MAG: ATP-dependent Clp protease proteolytic subunit [Elusimicrobia bacterium CG_4_10_14_0_2_um_filter_63_34]PJB23894.1 MAG: ATP-dependent Clp protease proteolytic subunit [Elusimicrobia bacterium CG_4_9_14_3_um_filter_62_55]
MIIPTILERWNQGSAVGYDIYSRLLKDRIIFVGGSEGVVTTDSANLLIAQMLYLEAEDNDKDIYLYINSPGGMVTAGYAVYDTMQYIKAPITTICMGMAMSFGAVLLAAGSKGKRMALPYSRIMIHQPLIGGYGISGQASDIQIEADEMMKTKRKLNELFAAHTGKNLEQIEKDMERNYYMSAEEAKAYGIIDHVIQHRPHDLGVGQN